MNRIRHAAFDLAKDAYNSDTHGKAKEILQKEFGVSFDESLEVYHEACDLVDACYQYGEKCRDSAITEEEAIADMKRAYPNFDDETYRSALSHGYFLSR
ncbi:hypothetical protein [Coraliomargarita akajimensis]|uniref:Uncharacterized protein n=1 Tax=Coraliomargarita akajimensis (strain DSM 45221 / IAM 15411 / JCM 23193 / KCTC 12865 / 04OKA010-24) TaxID=583355 RepID=D5ER75_CORAD|nr:hypothetical protein [Coraliomargarita akajimensis]ADE55919.1 hypothetical protein Caka_2906 [Coraliomargarita akajimensis DSM 45221]